MQAVSKALNELFESGSWFARAWEVRIWVIRVSGDLRKTALQMLTGFEFHHDNRSGWVILPDSHSSADRGWRVRANRLLAHWEERRNAFRERESIEMPEARLTEGDDAIEPYLSEFPSVLDMRQASLAVRKALREPLQGMVVVLAPATIEDVEQMGSEIEFLAKDPALAPFRWVWVLDSAQPWPSILDRFAEMGIKCECIPDPVQQKKDFAAMLSDGPANMFGRAGPQGVTPPPRVDDPPPMPAEQRNEMLRKEGINPDYLEKAPHLQRLILGAAIAMKDGKGEDAVRMQREAADLAASLEMFDIAVLCQIALASYLSGLGLRDDALNQLRRTIKLTHERGLILQESQAHLAAALLLALNQFYLDAAAEYGNSARCAEAAKVPLLAIEAWRMAGQVNLQLNEESEAAECFRHAIRVAEGSEIATVKDSTAPEVARKLAELCAKRGLSEQAESLYAQADAMENGEIGMKQPELQEA